MLKSLISKGLSVPLRCENRYILNLVIKYLLYIAPTPPLPPPTSGGLGRLPIAFCLS